MLMRATFSPRMLRADRQERETVRAISQQIASVAKDPDLLVACAVATIGMAASFAFMLAIATDSAVLVAQAAG